MKSSICYNCINLVGCVNSNSSAYSPISHCDMHEVKDINHSSMDEHAIGVLTPLIETSSTHDLCSSCEFKNNCNWKENNDFIFECEDYL